MVLKAHRVPVTAKIFSRLDLIKDDHEAVRDQSSFQL